MSVTGTDVEELNGLACRPVSTSSRVAEKNTERGLEDAFCLVRLSSLGPLVESDESPLFDFESSIRLF